MSHAFKLAGLSMALLGVAGLSAASLAHAAGTPTRGPLPLAATALSHEHALASGTPDYSYRLIAYPGALNTVAVGINPGVLSTQTQIVGSWTAGNLSPGFEARFSGNKIVTESYGSIDDQAGPPMQQAYSVNDLGQVVGDYIDSNNVFHAYEHDGGQFTPIEVPFSGAAGTYSPSINNAGEIVGGWVDAAGNSHAFTLIRGVYASFDYPGMSYTDAYAVNSSGDIAGYYVDADGNLHGFLRKGDAYSSIDYPGAVETYALGVNDADDVVGAYCPTSDCVTTSQGLQGFILKNGVYTSFGMPGETATVLAKITNKGQLLGSYIDQAGLTYSFLATPQGGSR